MRLIFLTGLPRCGSSWACRVLAAGTQSHLINEPFNYETYPERISHHLRYVPASADDDGIVAILRSEVRRRHPLRRIFRRPSKFVIKDVHAFLATERIAEALNPHVMVLLRHPCAMANSWRKLNYPVEDRPRRLYGQPQLLSDFLAPFEDHMRREGDFFFLFGVYWGAAYYVLSKLGERHPNWNFTTHESLCLSPEAAYTQTLAGMGFRFLPEGSEFLHAHDRQRADGENAYAVSRRTQDEPHKWKEELAPDEAQRIIEGAAPFGLLERFYAEA